MNIPGINPEAFPKGGEFVDKAITLQSRSPQITMPRDTMWPLRLHDEATKEVVSEILPELITALSQPVQPATRSQLHELFSTNPHERRLPWTYREDIEKLTYSTGAYRGPKDEKGAQQIYRGINYTFDHEGRLIKSEYIDDEGSYNSGRPNFQEFLAYDEDGYLVERTTWGYSEPSITDCFEYATNQEGRKTPVKMTRTLKVSGDGHSFEDSKPMTVDLANYEEWIAINPNGFTAVSREQLSPKELEITYMNVSERRKGILFTHPEQLEHALVMYGEGNYPTPGDKTALEHNDSVFAEHSSLGGKLFSLVARSGDMREFVYDRITRQVQDKWEQVQKNRRRKTEERVVFDFDYDGMGHFHKTHGNVMITKGGLELTLSAAYVGDRVEDQLASALQLRRGLRLVTIEIPINQTEEEGYFFIDVKAACEELGIPVSDRAIARYLANYLFENDKTPRNSYERSYGEQPVLWEDKTTGVTVDLVTVRRDYDADIDLDDLFRHDNTAIWGPLPREVRQVGSDGNNTPKLRVLVKPIGDPFAQETTERTDKIVRSHLMKISKNT